MQTRSQDRRGEDDAIIPSAPAPAPVPTPAGQMDPTPQRLRRAPASAADGASTSTPTRAEMTFTQEDMSAFLSTIQRSQAEIFKDLLQSVIEKNSVGGESSGTLSRCRSTFSGASSESVTAFIDSVDSYVDCVGVSDTNIIKGLSMLLVGEAATWWQGVKDTMSDWESVKENLISAFGDRRPPHRIYLDIFAKPQSNENTDLFVSRIRALFAKLPKNDVSINAQLDITYGLLHKRMRKKIRREEFQNFNDLLSIARNVEDSLGEGEKARARAHESAAPATPPPHTRRAAPPARASPPTSHAPPPPPSRSATPPSANPPTTMDPSTAMKTQQRPLCSYCKRYGHVRDQCRKLAFRGESEPFSKTADACDSGDKYKESFYSVELASSRKKCDFSNRDVSSNNHLNASKDSFTNVNNNSHNTSMPTNDARKYLCNKNNFVPYHCLENDSTSYRVPCESHSHPVTCQCHNFIPDIACNIQDNGLCFRQWIPHKTACTCTDSSNPNFVSNVNSKHFHNFHNVDDATCSNAKCTCGTSTDHRVLSEPVPYVSSSHFCHPCICVQNSNVTKCLQNGNVLKCRNCKCEKFENCFPKNNFVNNCENNLNSNDCICSGDVLLPGCSRERPAYRELRPIFNIEILGVTGTGLVDTAAKHCIAGHTLYALLLRKGYPLVPSSRQIKFADGLVRDMEVLTTTLSVSLAQSVIKIPFLIFPDSKNNETLLGIDFITAAGVVIDFHKESWYFSNNKNIEHKLLFEPTSRNVSCSAADILRDDEGAHLSPAERAALADVLVKHAHISEAGGGPTPYAKHCIPTGNHSPRAVPPYRSNPAKKELMKQKREKKLAKESTNFQTPGNPKRKPGHPVTAAIVLVQERGRSPGLEGEYIVNRSTIPATLPYRASRGQPPAHLESSWRARSRPVLSTVADRKPSLSRSITSSPRVAIPPRPPLGNRRAPVGASIRPALSMVANSQPSLSRRITPSPYVVAPFRRPLGKCRAPASACSRPALSMDAGRLPSLSCRVT